MWFTGLPGDVWTLIASFLHFLDLLRLQRCCRALYCHLLGDSELWVRCVEQSHNLPFCPWGPTAPRALRERCPQVAIAPRGSMGPCYPALVPDHSRAMREFMFVRGHVHVDTTPPY